MIIDFHTHTFPDAIADKAIASLSKGGHMHAFTDGKESGLLYSMQKAGIDISVCLPVATKSSQVEKINAHAAMMNSMAEQTGLVFFGCMHPDYEEYRRELKTLSDCGIRGIKLHPVFVNTDIDDIRYLHILEAAADFGLTVVVHGGIDIGFPDNLCCTPKKIANAVKQVGNIKLIAAHMGGWRMWHQARDELAPLKNVFIDTSFSLGYLDNADTEYIPYLWRNMLDNEQAVELIRAFGAERVLFGTDSPWRNQKDEAEQIDALPLTKEEKDRILYQNALELLKSEETTWQEPSSNAY